MKLYSFINEGVFQKIGKFFAPNGIGKMLNYTAAGTLVGHSAGGVIGVLYGCKVYASKDKTIQSMEDKIMDPETSAFKRRQIIDSKNLIMSMSDEEYRNYILMKYFSKGSAIGSTIGSTIGMMASRRT